MKPRVTWMASGDQNTAFFHNTVKARNARNSVASLTSSNGNLLKEVSDIKKEAIDYFNSFLNNTAKESTLIPDLSHLIHYRCSISQANALIAPVTGTEIKATLDSMPSNKASGPDGFTTEFFRASWNITGKDFISAIQSFFIYRYMPNGTNATILSLIPKIDSPVTMADFRPIACCNVLYKVISKLLANHLKRILPEAIELKSKCIHKRETIVGKCYACD